MIWATVGFIAEATVAFLFYKLGWIRYRNFLCKTVRDHATPYEKEQFMKFLDLLKDRVRSEGSDAT